ncbi:MAG TPA: VOC family protein [Chthoniobacterales bacterium]
MNTPCVAGLDHLVITVADISKTIDFYREILGMEVVEFGPGRKALKFGSQKINLHQKGAEFEPKAEMPTPGSADLCFLSPNPLEEWFETLTSHAISVVEGPVNRTGATATIRSIYIRDPDGNLIEISNLLQ